MKTPRELLLARHRAVEPKLDARRQRVIAFLSSKAAVAPSPSADLLSDQGLWRSMVSSRLAVFSAWLRQLRWHLAGMAAVWMSVAILNGIDRPSTPRFAVTGKGASAPRELLATLRENRRQISELLGLSNSEAKVPTPASPSSTPVPSRRGERRATGSWATMSFA